MFALITGKLAHKSASEVIVDVGGIGYQVFIPLSTFYELPETGDNVSFHIHTHVKEDAIQLFGFRSHEEKSIFQLMIQVSGIGPKLAINVLSGITAPELTRAVSGGDLARLVTIPGIGKKTAERMVLELRDKFSKLLKEEMAGPARTEIPEDILMNDALSALENLGYKQPVAKKALDQVRGSVDGDLTIEELLKQALKFLSK
ncbi:MAG: Holliday junction branch migration protein RuvA [Syntrophaceae bacterium]